MEWPRQPAGPWLRAYAWSAVFGWFGGIPVGLALLLKTGVMPWPLFLLIAASVPLIPLLLLRGPGILGDSFRNLFPRSSVRGPPALAWPLCLVLMSGFAFGAWTTWREGRVRQSVREAVRTMGEDAVVIVDGETLTAENARALLRMLADLKPRPAHHSHPETRFPVLLRSDGGDLDLVFARDSESPREYWIFAPGEDGVVSRNEIGRIRTGLLDHVRR
jgi:hypothetical protein